MAGLRALRQSITTRLLAAGIDEAQEESRRLLLALEGVSATTLLVEPDLELEPQALAQIEAWVQRREAREPLSQVLGHQAFWTLDLKVSRDVLTPRADSETLIEAVLARRPDRERPYRLIDLGTGSGALILALLSEYPNAQGLAVDLSAPALAIAQENAERCELAARCQFRQGSWADGLEGPFDIIISNPPYIATEVMADLDREVRDYEPHLALDGGVEGLEPYPHLLTESGRLLSPGGLGVFEIGYDQGKKIQQLAEKMRFQDIEIKTDLGGRDRALIFETPC